MYSRLRLYGIFISKTKFLSEENQWKMKKLGQRNQGWKQETVSTWLKVLGARSLLVLIVLRCSEYLMKYKGSLGIFAEVVIRPVITLL